MLLSDYAIDAGVEVDTLLDYMFGDKQQDRLKEFFHRNTTAIGDDYEMSPNAKLQLEANIDTIASIPIKQAIENGDIEVDEAIKAEETKTEAPKAEKKPEAKVETKVEETKAEETQAEPAINPPTETKKPRKRKTEPKAKKETKTETPKAERKPRRTPKKNITPTDTPDVEEVPLTEVPIKDLRTYLLQRASAEEVAMLNDTDVIKAVKKLGKVYRLKTPVVFVDKDYKSFTKSVHTI
ncbi:MAG: hypothetical protein K6D02_01795 [Lachnospiraceae bacterium]|nr:hypothetical protein [Lachnospiraceae bacterium]